jgi:hypothetical protein
MKESEFGIERIKRTNHPSIMLKICFIYFINSIMNRIRLLITFLKKFRLRIWEISFIINFRVFIDFSISFNKSKKCCRSSTFLIKYNPPIIYISRLFLTLYSSYAHTIFEAHQGQILLLISHQLKRFLPRFSLALPQFLPKFQ